MNENRSLVSNAGAVVRGTLMSAFGLSALIFVNAVQTLSLLIKPFSGRAFRRINRACANSWWGMCVSGAQLINGGDFLVTGADIPARENAIIVSNHQQMPDIPTIMAFAKSRQRLGDLKFFVKDILKWVPGVGWGMLFLDCVFVKRNWSSDAGHILKTFSTLVDNQVPVWLVSFVEGTRARLHKIEASREFALSRGLEPLDHVLMPRTKGFAATVQGLREHVPAVYDFTIGYEEGVPTLWQYIKGSVDRIHLHVRRFQIEDLPTQEEDVRQWLLNRWTEKDRLLEHFYAQGAFPTEALPQEMAVEV
ncbi:MAG: acyltransferase [Acidobacteria bacterium]|nr:acyltransferase [Acidobacteriota bacterium]